MKKRLVLFSLTVLVLGMFLLTPDQRTDAGVGLPIFRVTANGGCLFNCPQGDGVRFDDFGGIITIIVMDITGSPIRGIPAADFWVDGDGCGGNMILCGGSSSCNADSATDANGQTTISGAVAAGGCGEVGLAVVVQGIVVLDTTGLRQLCLPYEVRSPDITGDLVVNLADLSVFATGYTSPPQPYNKCVDYNCDGVINLADYSRFAAHYLHRC